MVVTGVAERMPERLSRLMYIDAAVPRDGESLMDVIRPEIGAHIAERVQTHGQGWLVTFESSDRRSTPQPFQTFTQPLAVRNSAATAIPRTYFYCTNTQAGGGIFLKSAQRARTGLALL